MKKTRILTLLLCTALLVGSVSAAFVPQKAAQEAYTVVWGAIVSNDGDTLHVKNSAETALSDVIIRVPAETPIIDAVSGAAVKQAALKVGQSIYVTISPAVATSMPPQATALAIVANLPADYQAPTFAMVDAVSLSEDSKNGVLAELFTADGMLQAKITKDTVLARYTMPGAAAITSMPNITELTPGSRVFLWYGASTKSVPAQTTLTKCLIVPSTYAGYVSLAQDAIRVNGQSLNVGKQLPVQNADGVVLVPLRLVAEAAGWTVGWSSNDRPIHLTKGEQDVFVTIGSEWVDIGDASKKIEVDGVTIGSGSGSRVGVAAELRGGTTYVDSRVFQQSMNLYTTISAK